MTKLDLHVNGSLSVELRTDGEIERVILDAMAASSELGKKVRILKEPDGCYRISAERSEKV